MSTNHLFTRVAIAFATLSAVGLCSVSHAQPKPPSHEHIRDLESFIGEWKGRFDPPGEVPVGELKMDVRWIGNQSYIRFDVRFTPDGIEGAIEPMQYFIGYNGHTGKPHAWQLGIGGQADCEAKLTAQTLNLIGLSGFNVRGQTTSRDTRFELRTEDEMIITNENLTRNGEPLPDSQREDVLVLRRVPGSR